MIVENLQAKPSRCEATHLVRPMSENHAAVPSVTVFAICYNHARFVIECLESIRNQTFGTFQLIVTDDCSTDESQAKIEAWLAAHRPDAIFIRHDRNVGLCATLNEALALATGDHISMIATDDLWEPNKIEVQLAAMRLGAKIARFLPSG